MVEQAGDCISFLGFLLYVGSCLLGKKYVYLKKSSLLSTISVRETLKKGCKQCSPRSRNSFKSHKIRSATDCFHKFASSSSSSMRKRADRLHNNNNDFAFATQSLCESRGGRAVRTFPRFSRDEGDRGSGPTWHGS